jgi:hypothetical protein
LWNKLGVRECDRSPRGGWPLCAALALGALIGLPSLVYPFGRDQAMFAYVGRGWLDGFLPYRDSWDNKPPGIYALYGLASLLPLPQMMSVRAVDLVATLLTAALLGLIAGRWWGRRAGALAAFLYAAGYYLCFDYWDTAQTEGYLTLFLAAAVAAAALGRARVSPAAMAAVGALCAMAALFKTTAVLPAAVLIAWAWWRGGRRPGLLAAAAGGFAAPVALAGLYFWRAGALSEMWELVIGFNLSYASGAPAKVFTSATRSGPLYAFTTLGILGPLALLGVGAGLLPPRKRGVAFVVAWACAAGLTVFAQGRLFHYHWQVTLAPVALAAACGVETLVVWQREPPQVARRLCQALPLVFLAAGLVALATTIPPGYAASAARLAGLLSPGQHLGRFTGVFGFSVFADLRAADYLRTHTSDGDTVQVWAFEPLVNIAAGRRAPTRFVANHALMDDAWSFGKRRWWREFRRGMRARPPRYIVTVNNPAGASREPVEVDHAWLREFVARNYRFETQVGPMKMYRLRDDGSPGGKTAALKRTWRGGSPPMNSFPRTRPQALQALRLEPPRQEPPRLPAD